MEWRKSWALGALLATAVSVGILAGPSSERNIPGDKITRSSGAVISLPESSTTLCGKDEPCELSQKSLSDALTFSELSETPAPPDAGKQAIYPKGDGKFYRLDSSGIETELGSGGWRAFTFDYTDLADSSTTNSAAILNLPAGQVLEAIVLRHTTAFGGGSISAYNVSVGVSGEPERYLTSLDVSEAVDGGVFKSAVFGSGPEHFSSTTSITLYATSVGDDLDEATAGELTVWVKTSKP